MYSNLPRLYVRLCVCLSLSAYLHYCMDPDVTLGNGRGCPLVVLYWADLQSVYEFRCYGNILAYCEMSARMLVLVAWLAIFSYQPSDQKVEK